jgi:hypothetical protein
MLVLVVGMTCWLPPLMSSITFALSIAPTYESCVVYARLNRKRSKYARAGVSLVFTSFNTGFRFKEEGEKQGPKGTLPVLVARVGGNVTATWLQGMNYRMLDWHGEELASGNVAADTLEISADQPVFVIELHR